MKIALAIAERAFRYGPPSRFVCASRSPRLVEGLEEYAAQFPAYRKAETVFGERVVMFRTAYGEFLVVPSFAELKKIEENLGRTAFVTDENDYPELLPESAGNA